MADRPGKPTTTQKVMFDISDTEKASHVYIKQADKKSLCPSFEGPYPIVSRPTRSTIVVKLSVKKDGSDHLQTYHWSWCKPAVMREDAQTASRPRPGRPSTEQKQTPSAPEPVVSTNVNNQSPPSGNIQTESRQSSSPSSRERPVRASRNPNPSYIHAAAAPG